MELRTAELTLAVSSDGGRVAFEVRDTGPGIAPEEQARIFDAFYQTAAGIARGEGTGLGLNISREFVRLMGGELTVESTPKQGSTFHFVIPLTPAPAPPVAERRERVLGLVPGQAGKRILVAEDHPDNRELIVRLLEQIGFEVRAANDGREAVVAFESWHPDLILMDMRMPVMDGYQAARQIRNLSGGSDVRILALTASAFLEERNAILAAGCDEMVCKPIEEDRLFGTIAELLGVKFRYEEPAQEAERSAAAIDLGRLPDDLRKKLANTAEQLDDEACQIIINTLRAEFPAEAQLIADLIKDFHFDRVLELCARSGED